MRQILLLLALLASGVSAQTVTVGQYYLTDPSGATIGSKFSYNTDCKKLAQSAAAKTADGAKTYKCVFDITVTYPPKPSATWTKIADEDQPFTLPAAATVRFGVGTTWLQKDFKAGSFSCSLATFGADPAVGTFKQCQISGAAPTPPVTPTPPVDPTPPTNPTPPTGNLQVTRTTCTAPCAVLFDATASGDFRAAYAFDFGDPKSDTWAVSGKSKNTETGGPVASHVYLTPGTYTAKVNGASATIAVADPAAVYAGTKTVCVGKSFEGCPAGAAQQASLPSGTAWNGKRWLLQAGQSFGAISIQDGNSGVQVGSYGSGAKPSVDSVGVGNWRPATTSFATDVTVMDLAVRNGMGQCIGSRVLFLRNDVKATGGGIQMAFGGEDYWANDPYMQIPKGVIQNAREIFFVENSGINSDTSSSQYGIFGSGSRIALMGNRFGRQQYHSARLTACDRCFIAHNEFQGIDSAGIYHALKLHSGGLMAYADGMINKTDGVTGWVSSKIVISSNLLGNAANNESWTAAIAPQNDQYAEGIEDVILDGNVFAHGKNTSLDIVVGGRRITTRGNTVQGGAKLLQGAGHTGALPAAWNGPNNLQ